MGALAMAAVLGCAVEACVGDDPSSAPTPPDGGNVDATTGGDAGGSDATAGLRVEPASIDLAPNASVSIQIRGGTPGATVTLAVATDQVPDGGTASGVALAASSLILSPTGEGSVEIKAAADATQQRFKVTVNGGPSPVVVPGRVTGKPGTLDLFFGDHGGYFDFFDADSGDTTANSVVVQPDGKFVVGGTGKAYQQMLIARFTADGALDTSFAGKGYVLIPGARSPQMAILSDGSIAIAAAAPNDPKLFRLGATGAFVPGWGDAAGIDPGLGYGTLDPAFARSGDAVLLGGVPKTGGEDAGVAIKKYLPDAGLDPTFGAGGTASFAVGPMGAILGRIYALAVEPTGSIWASGTYYPGTNPSKSWVRRLGAKGTPETYGPDGTFDGAGTALVVQDTKLVGAAYDYGGSKDGMSVFRVSGSNLDATFGSAGATKLSSQSGAGATSIALDASGRIYVANGGVNVVSTFDVYRVTANGMLDTTFADNGKFTMPGRAYGLAVSGRQLIVVGVNDPTDQRRARIARLWL